MNHSKVPTQCSEVETQVQVYSALLTSGSYSDWLFFPSSHPTPGKDLQRQMSPTGWMDGDKTKEFDLSRRLDLANKAGESFNRGPRLTLGDKRELYYRPVALSRIPTRAIKPQVGSKIIN
ncbi:hypothetical protein J6590_008135 [Homalodisca vitripennis]|nr:hypothetical protein J6590_008135 [Homalodisca vitripennis]